jgi:BRCT domain type II-containing protein
LDDELANDFLQDEQAAMEFLKTHGLRVEKVPLFSTTSKLFIGDKLSPAQIQKVNELAKKDYLWGITAL